MWADHFETLGQPTIDNSYNENFRIKVESAVEQIFVESCTELLFVYDTMKEVCQGLKCGVAGGPDMTTYEHLKYGDLSYWIFSPNYTCLYLNIFYSSFIQGERC